MTSPIRRVSLAAVPFGLAIAIAVAGCGATPSTAGNAITLPPQPTAAPFAPPAPASAKATAEPADAKMVHEWVKIDHGWMAPHVTVTAAEAKVWAADAVNAKTILPPTRHVLIKLPSNASPAEEAAVRKKAQAILARLRKGEDFAKVARETSDDPGSKDRGGLYPGSMVPQFIEEYRAAYASLAPGEITKDLVKTTFGWHVIKKDRPDEAAMIEALQRARAPAAAQRLADQIAVDLKVVTASGAKGDLTIVTRDAIVRLVNGAAANDLSRPSVQRITTPGGGDHASRPAAECGRILATPKDGIAVVPADDKGSFIVAVAHAETVAERNARLAKGEEESDESTCGVGGAGGADGQLTPAQVRALIEKLQKEKERLDRESGGGGSRP